MCELKYLEAKITEHCNYRCKGCNNYGNIASREEYDIEQFEKDIYRISSLFTKIDTFHILGGEPLLNKNVCQYISISRKYFKDTNIYLITNGSLLSTMDDYFFRVIKENKVKIHISHYPDKKNETKIQQGIDLIKEKNIDYIKIDTNIFHVSLLFQNNKYNVDETYSVCSNYLDCTNIYNGMIYKCPRPYALKHYDNTFGTNYSNVNDGIDIYNEVTAEDIISYLSKPISTCKYCTPVRGYLKWQQCNAEVNDWQINDENKFLFRTDLNYEDLEDSLKELNPNIVSVNHTKKKAEFYKCSIKELKNLHNRTILIWLNDIRCVAYYDLFKIVAEKYDIKIIAVIPREERLGKTIYKAKIGDSSLIGEYDNILILASDAKGILYSKIQISKILKDKGYIINGQISTI